MLVNILFPLLLQLNILQLEGYEIRRFSKWILHNFFRRTIEGKKKLVYTTKARNLLVMSLMFNLLCTYLFLKTLGIYGFILAFLLFTQPYISLSIAVALYKPYEIINRTLTVLKTRNKIKKLKKSHGLKVIGITGSYGKTSTKEYLYQMLKTKYKVLKTPESYNTVFGIARVVDYELHDEYDFFICEMGAYKIGEIKELTKMVDPDYGILTGINEQHLERFGKLENTIKAKFELIEALPSHGYAYVNLDDVNVRSNYKRYSSAVTIYPYSINQPECIESVDEKGTDFILKLNGNSYYAHTYLLGIGAITNMTAAASLAHKLGVPQDDILRAISKIKPVKHRLELKKLLNGYLIIDDAYSSNVAGFTQALNVLNRFPNNPKVLVTPGIVELGELTEKIHIDFGTKASEICDLIILVGKNDRTTAMEKGIRDKNKVLFINTINDLWDTLKKTRLNNPVVLLENDLPDNY